MHCTNNVRQGLWVPAFAGTTRRESAFSRQPLSESCKLHSALKKEEGAGKTGCALHPRSRVQLCITRMRTRAYRFSGNTPAFPAQWLYGLYRALPGESEPLATIAPGGVSLPR